MASGILTPSSHFYQIINSFLQYLARLAFFSVMTRRSSFCFLKQWSLKGVSLRNLTTVKFFLKFRQRNSAAVFSCLFVLMVRSCPHYLPSHSCSLNDYSSQDRRGIRIYWSRDFLGLSVLSTKFLLKWNSILWYWIDTVTVFIENFVMAPPQPRSQSSLLPALSRTVGPVGENLWNEAGSPLNLQLHLQK